MSRRARWAVVAASCALVLAATVACSNTPDATSTAPSPTITPGVNSAGPLDDYFTAIYGSWDPDGPVEVSPVQVMLEEQMAACMAEQGFEYTPYNPANDSGKVTGYALVHELGWGSVAFAQEFGFGLTTEPWGAGQGSLSFPQAPSGDGGTAGTDPNEEYTRSLSEEAQREYLIAMNGPSIFDPSLEDEPGWNFATDSGCVGQVWDESNVYALQPFGALGQEAADLRASIDRDGRVTQALTQWGECMAGRGYGDLTTFFDAENLIYEAVNDFMQQHTEISWGGFPQLAEIEAALPGPQAELRITEISTAVAAAECREEAGFDQIRADVDREYQQEFVELHRNELDEWVLAANAGDS